MRYLFRDYTLDVDRRELRCGSAVIAVQPQVFDLLHCLVRNRGRIVSKDDLIATIWRGRAVSDSTIACRVTAARKALGDSGEAQRLIRTVPRIGLRFVAGVRMDTEGEERASAAGAGSVGASSPPRPGLPISDQPAIAVLPFINMSDEPEQEYFSDGLSEDIIIALSRLRWCSVMARNSSFSYKGRSVRGIGGELGVGYLVEGSVRRSGDRVRITAQLSDLETGGQIWGERYDRRLGNVFAVQDEITDAIVATIEPRIYAAEGFHARRRPRSLDVWDLVMRALSHFWRLTREDNLAGQALLEKALAIDPNYARALAVMSFSRVCGAHMGWEDRELAVPAAECAALAAIRADDTDPWAHFATAAVSICRERVDDALAGFEAALRLNPNFPLAQGFYGWTLTWAGRWQEGGEAARRALRLSPRDPFSAIYDCAMGYTAFVARDYADAMRWAREGLRQRTDLAWAWRVFVAAAAMKGEIGAAKTALHELRRVQPNISLAWLGELPCVQDLEREHYLDAFRRAGLV